MIHVNSLSKVVGPGLRVGWVAARGPISERIAMAKLLSDFHTSTLTQHMAARWLASGAHDRHVKRRVPFYRERRDALHGRARAPPARRVPGGRRRRAATTCGSRSPARSTSAPSTRRPRATA